VLDGTADHETYRAILGDNVHIKRIHVKQNLDIIQAIDTPVGKRKLTDPKNRMAYWRRLSPWHGLPARV